MDKISFKQLVQFLPRGDEFRASHLPAGLSYVQEKNTGFIEPYLRVVRPIDVGTTSLVLVSAPGAVGKSTLAAEIAQRQGATIWDLSQVNVGKSTFAGTILEAYDFEATGVLKRIRNGNFLFVLDALDEAQMRAGANNFESFIDDIAVAHESSRAQPTSILLARSDTAEWIALLLEEAGIEFAQLEIDLFDKDASLEFIERRLDRLREAEGSALVHRQQPGPFDKAVQRLFEIIYSLFGVSRDQAWEDPRVRRFLGYAPVLEALADYLNVGNYQQFVVELEEGAHRAADPWEFLTDIVERLLQREEGKVQKNVKGKVESSAAKLGWAEWDCLYRPEEQCSRLISRVLEVAPVIKIPKLPPELSRLYEEALEIFQPQHPFLAGSDFANVVFREYVYAWTMTQGGQSTGEELREALKSPGQAYLPSKLLSHFIDQMSGSNEAALIDGRDFGVFYESCLSRGSVVNLDLLETDDAIEATVDIDETEKEFFVEVYGDEVHLWRRLQGSSIDIGCRLRFGLPAQRFVFDKEVEVRSHEIVVSCEEVEIGTDASVRLLADSFLAEWQPTRLKVRGDLAVFWPHTTHPWADYKVAPPRQAVELTETVRGDTLYRLLMMFRRTRNRKTRTLHAARWSEHHQADRDELFALAFREGLLEKNDKGNYVRFNSKFDSLKTLVGGEAGDPSPEAVDFLKKYLGSERAEGVLRH